VLQSINYICGDTQMLRNPKMVRCGKRMVVGKVAIPRPITEKKRVVNEMMAK